MNNTHKNHIGALKSARLAMWPIGAWILGMFLSFFPTYASGFRAVQGGLGDGRLVNFTLEHSYRWLCGWQLAEDFWSPPIFYPVPEVAAYTDLMLGAAWLYWPWRIFGLDPHTAYQLWMQSAWSLNFLACYLLLKIGLRTSVVGASAGAYLFAFGSPLQMNISHQQLAPQFFLVLSLAGLIAIFRNPDDPKVSIRGWIASIAFGGGLTAQVYTAIYPAIFFVLGLTVVAGVVLVAPSTQKAVLQSLRNQATPLIVTGLVAIFLLIPAASRYQGAAETTGLRFEEDVHLPKALSLILPGHSNLVYGSIQRALPLDGYRGLSQTNGIGLVTMTACLLGLWIGRRNRIVQVLVIGFGGLIFLTMSFPGGWSPWLEVRKLVPGAAALRAVSRMGLMILYPAALGLAITTDQFWNRRRWIIISFLVLGVVSEQTHRKGTFDKANATNRIGNIADRVPNDAETFLLVVRGDRWDRYVHDDAAWVALKTGIPTINGRYGNFPSRYPFQKPWIKTSGEETRIRDSLNIWANYYGLDPDSIALVEIVPRISMVSDPKG